MQPLPQMPTACECQVARVADAGVVEQKRCTSSGCVSVLLSNAGKMYVRSYIECNGRGRSSFKNACKRMPSATAPSKLGKLTISRPHLRKEHRDFMLCKSVKEPIQKLISVQDSEGQLLLVNRQVLCWDSCYKAVGSNGCTLFWRRPGSGLHVALGMGAKAGNSHGDQSLWQKTTKRIHRFWAV